jgi:hypothetical protein
MRVGVVGSWKAEDASDWNLSDEFGFKEAARALGAEIARRQHQIVVGSESQRTADYFAVEGVVQALGSTIGVAPAITVVRPNDDKVPFHDFRSRYDHLFTSGFSPDAKWRVTHLLQVQRSDALLIVGGGELSYQAGVAAAVSGRRVVPIGSFGGAGRRLINLFQLSRGQWDSNVPTVDELGSLLNPWNPTMVERVLRVLRITDFPRVLIIHGRSDDRFALKDYLQNRLSTPEPVIMAQHLAPGLTLPEKFERLASRSDAAIALVTPDDVGGLSDTAPTTHLESRARQNVWLEVGWFWGRLGRNRFLLLVRGQPTIPSDLSGMEYVTYAATPLDCADSIRAFVAALAEGDKDVQTRP